MTLQQMEYVVAVDKYRHFQQAAEACGVTQPTLSAMLSKLEEELDIRIFDRTNKAVHPTEVGQKIIRQAQRAVSEAHRLKEVVAEERERLTGSLRLRIGPTIAPYIVPKFIELYTNQFSTMDLTIEEVKSEPMFGELQKNMADIGIAITGDAPDGIFQIPLYTEPFYIYLAENYRHNKNSFSPKDLASENMWVMKEAQCFRDSAFSFCKGQKTGRQIYEAGSITTLIQIVDHIGGYTIIPEMHLPFLNDAQRKQVRPIEGDYISYRKVSMYIRNHEVRQRLVQSVVDTLKAIVPASMHDSYIRRPIQL